MQTFHIIPSAHACTELIVETNHLRKYLEQADLHEVGAVDEADVILVATCSFNQEFEDEAYGNIRRSIDGRKPGARVLVSGCYPRIAPKVFETLKADVTDIPPLDMRKIESVIPSKYALAEVMPNAIDMHEMAKSKVFMLGNRLKRFFRRLDGWVAMPKWLDSLPMPDWYFIQGGNGCMGNCTFCAIKHARGKIQSTPIDQILPQVERAVRRGYKTISFAGTDMGCWGHDLGLALPDLLQAVIDVPGDFVVDMHYVEADWIIRNYDRLEPIFQTGRIRSFGTPAQSGSNRILKLMGRKYTVEQYIDVVNRILRTTRVRSMNSIVMVGFPSETVEDYRATYDLVDAVDISYWCLLRYEGRFDVPSEQIEPKVPDEIKDHRRWRIQRKVQLRNYLGLPSSVAEAVVRLRYGAFR